jgi:hypothetical protein
MLEVIQPAKRIQQRVLDQVVSVSQTTGRVGQAMVSPAPQDGQVASEQTLASGGVAATDVRQEHGGGLVGEWRLIRIAACA